ncbi:MAG TPA: protein TolQ [Methylophaga aminisulfidivorans]|uniref:Tol-Pal system protein TolQ n=2 Tax=root TaxID=1 RepID=A0A7C2AAU1_9GAMM|nr:protein TolQ [Methylophaga aminisulfidivorans]
MTADLSIISLILEASLIVKLVMLVLLLISFYSWFIIFRKRSDIAKAKRDADNFEDKFWSGNELNRLYEDISSRPHSTRGMEGIFEVGFKEFVRLKKSSNDSNYVLEGAQRVMRISLAREIDQLETSLPFLATAGSTSPYIGLFGTVWGIMNSFRALGNVQQATLSMVAPGISEALIATAMGLFAAIPAVIAYNRYSNEVERLINRYDTFLEEFSSILQRQQD